MKTHARPRSGSITGAARLLAGAVALSMTGPLIGCSSPNNQANAGSPAPYSAPAPAPPPRSSNPIANMSTGQKVAVLAGAAALYYLYKKHQNNRGTGADGQYYRSKNGGIYYRDAQGNPHWVTPPAGGIQVPASEAPQYEQGARQYGFTNTVPSAPPGPGGY